GPECQAQYGAVITLLQERRRFGTMIIGGVSIDRVAGVLNTANDSYPLDRRTVFSVLRPFRIIGWMGVGLLGSFAIAFRDLLWMHEIGM
ncbi:MAG: hypothetical protein AAGK33_12850, partial [Pseudomonadota bacterium]